jgi:hypothetical protein
MPQFEVFGFQIFIFTAEDAENREEGIGNRQQFFTTKDAKIFNHENHEEIYPQITQIFTDFYHNDTTIFTAKTQRTQRIFYL